MDERGTPLSLTQAARYIGSKHGLKVSRMTLWRWAHQGRKRPRRIRLNVKKPNSFRKKVFTTQRDIDDFMSILNAKA